MKHYTDSGNSTGISVVMPGFFNILNYAENLDRVTSNAFAYADDTGRQRLFQMRKLLSAAYPNKIHKCSNPEDYVSVLEQICSFAKMQTFSPQTVLALPGLISPPHEIASHKWNRELYKRLISLGKHITVDLTDYALHQFCLEFLENAVGYDASISVITDRQIPPDIMKAIACLWNSGNDVILCNRSEVGTVLGSDSICKFKDLAVFDGRFLLPGYTLMTCIPFDMGNLTDCTESTEQYTRIKETVRVILQNEVSRRFSRSARGHSYYRTNCEDPSLVPWGLCFPRCIGSAKDPHIRGIFTGGVAHDAISISLHRLNQIPFGEDVLSDILKCLTAACRFFIGDFPIKAIPHFKDVRCANDFTEIESAIRNHTAMVGDIGTSSVLEICTSEKFSSSDTKYLSSLISGFFGLGGKMIKFTIQGDAHD